MRKCDSDAAGVAAGLAMKEKQTIVDPWPLKFGFGPSTPETRKEFAMLLGSSCTGQERYVEWKAVGSGVMDVD